MFTLERVAQWTNRIYHWSLMQTEKFQPEGKQIMPETGFNEFPALSVDPKVGISVCIGDQCLIILLANDIKRYYLSFDISFIFDILCRIMTFSERRSMFFVVPHVTSLIKFRVRTPLLTSRVSCLSPRVRL